MGNIHAYSRSKFGRMPNTVYPGRGDALLHVNVDAAANSVERPGPTTLSSSPFPLVMCMVPDSTIQDVRPTLAPGPTWPHGIHRFLLCRAARINRSPSDQAYLPATVLLCLRVKLVDECCLPGLALYRCAAVLCDRARHAENVM